MNYLQNVFLLSISLTLVFAGLMKIIWYKNTIKSIKKIGIFPEKISNIIGIFMPLFEINMAWLLLFSLNKIVIISIIGYILFFLSINLKFVFERKTIKCCCYGKAIQSNLGKGGLIHYFYLLLDFVIGLLYTLNNNQLFSNIKVNNLEQLIFFIVCSCLIFINGITLRVLVEKYIR